MAFERASQFGISPRSGNWDVVAGPVSRRASAIPPSVHRETIVFRRGQQCAIEGEVGHLDSRHAPVLDEAGSGKQENHEQRSCRERRAQEEPEEQEVPMTTSPTAIP